MVPEKINIGINIISDIIAVIVLFNTKNHHAFPGCHQNIFK